VSLEQVVFGPGVPWIEPEQPEVKEEKPLGRNDIQRVVDTISRASSLAVVPVPRKPWLPELATVYDLAALPTRRIDTELVYGVADDPEAQAQPVAAFIPDRDGSMIVYGTGGSGKSAFLRSIAIASGLTARGGPCQVYGLDFGARGLSSLEVLPHVGSIINGDDEERVARLVRKLRQIVDDRARDYAAVNAGTITEYRILANRPDEARIILLVDGVGAFRQSYETAQRMRWFDMVQSIAADGRPVGVHLVVSADRPGAVLSGLSSFLQRRLVLRLANENDESMLAVPRDMLGADTPPGRGVIDGQQVQVAVLGRDPSAPGQARALERLAESMRRAGVTDAERIHNLPERVSLSSLPALVDGWPTLGISDETLAPIGFPNEGVLVVVGPPKSGRTTVLAALVASVRRSAPERRFIYLGTRRSPLRHSLDWDLVAETPESVAEVVPELLRELSDEGETGARALVVIEGLPEFLNTVADAPLLDVIKVCRSHEHLLLCDGDTNAMAGSWPLQQAVKSARSGIALQPDQSDGDMIFRTPFPRFSRAEFPPGRGILVHGGSIVRVQVGLPE
jgi:S-DNA-T family DNA segregation ATPase FtsK/SpoIIIE